MDAMKDMAAAMKAIDRRVKSGRELARVRADAERIQRLAETMTAAFPRGSEHHPSEAKPAVWKNWDDFEDRARKLAADSGALARVDWQDAAAIASQTKRVTQSCSGCHEIYRSKKR